MEGYRKKSKGGYVTFIIGALLLGSVFLLPDDIFSSFLGSVRWGGVVTLVLCPILGLFGFGMSIKAKRPFAAILNVALMLSIFLAVPAVYMISGV